MCIKLVHFLDYDYYYVHLQDHFEAGINDAIASLKLQKKIYINISLHLETMSMTIYTVNVCLTSTFSCNLLPLKVRNPRV